MSKNNTSDGQNTKGPNEKPNDQEHDGSVMTGINIFCLVLLI